MKNRAWIIGNAPSIAELDMTRLKDEVTFSSNRAYLAYEEWGWYPTYYCVIDSRMLKQTTDDVNALIKGGKIKEFYLHVEGSEGIIKAPNVHIIEFDKTDYEKHGGKWGFRPENFFYCADVSAFMLQVAYKKGYRDIYIAGVDMSWGMYGETGPGKDADHFRPDYETDNVRMSGVYAYGHFKSWKKSIRQATADPYNMSLMVTTPESRLREFLPYQPFETVPMTEMVINYDQWREPKPFGISGCFRLRNESQFMAAAVRSFLPYLDEAVLCVQPSDDNTAEIAEQLAEQYPDKIRLYYYPYIVDWIDTPEFFEKDPNKPGHLVHMSNYALSKCSYSWICKVEGDVIALPPMQNVIDAVNSDPEGINYYGMIILNLAGSAMDKFSKENPRNGGWDEAVFNNDPDQFHFERINKWEVVTAHHKTCIGWTGLHMKRCKSGKDVSWNGETYWKLTRRNLTKALNEHDKTHSYPAKDNPHGIDELFDGAWQKWLKPPDLKESEAEVTTTPLVTVILPTYSRPVFLERALRSIHAQTFQDYEIIVVNDAGDDVSEIVSKFPKTRYLEHKENKGLAASRNTGVRAAMGKYIAFLDDDDFYYPIHLWVLVTELNKGTLIAYTNAYRWEQEKKLRLTLDVDYSRARICAGCPFYVMNVMLHASIFKDHKFDESLKSHEDYDLWLTLSDEHFNFKHIPIITAIYSRRIGDDQISNRSYHQGYFNIVRKKHGVDGVMSLHQQRQLERSGRNNNHHNKIRILKTFNGVFKGESKKFIKDEVCVDIKNANDYVRAGYAEVAL